MAVTTYESGAAEVSLESRDVSDYPAVLEAVLNEIEAGRTGAGFDLVVHYYYGPDSGPRINRTLKEYESLLWLTVASQRYQEASAMCRNEVCEILYVLDPRFNHPGQKQAISIRVDNSGEMVPGTQRPRLNYTVVDGRS